MLGSTRSIGRKARRTAMAAVLGTMVAGAATTQAFTHPTPP